MLHPDVFGDSCNLWAWVSHRQGLKSLVARSLQILRLNCRARLQIQNLRLGTDTDLPALCNHDSAF